MRESSKAALGGIVCALSVVIMLSTYISPLLVYTAPPFAGLLLLLIVNELGYKWAFGTYAAISLLSVFVIADKESAVFFTMFFGYFPILALWLEKKLKLRFICYLVKLLIFNASVILSVFICFYFFGVSYDDVAEEGVLYTVTYIILMNVFFFIYDKLIIKMQLLYVIKFQKRFRKLFRIK